jgi:hypothetical protein
MRRHLSAGLFLIICLTTGLLLAQDAPQPAAQPAETEKLPTLDEILAKFTEVSGGAAALEKLDSFVAVGTFEQMGTVMQLELGWKQPDKWFFILKMGDQAVFSQASSGPQGWVNMQGTIQPMSDDQRTGTAALLDVRFPIRIREHFPNLSLKGKGKTEGRDAWVAEATSKAGSPVSFYFEALTGLIVEVDATAETPNGTIQSQTFMEDFRDVDGVKTAFAMRQMGGGDWTIKLTEVKYNVDIPDTKFEEPKATTP